MIEVIKKFIQIEKDLNNSYKIVGYVTPNGRRLILTLDDNKTIALNDRLKIATYDEDDNIFYKNSLDLIKSYIDDGEVPITDLIFFDDSRRAMTWLMEQED
ncbi:MAG: hypothetical protein AB7V16_07070 [Vulcanibacillus sp.]